MDQLFMPLCQTNTEHQVEQVLKHSNLISSGEVYVCVSSMSEEWDCFHTLLIALFTLL